MKIFSVIEASTGKVLQQVEADYLQIDTYHNTVKLYQCMPWYRCDRLMGVISTDMDRRAVLLIAKPADVAELERMVGL